MKKYLLLIALTGAVTAATAQNINKELEVTREYTPKVAAAVKFDLQPDMTDTLKLRPDVPYEITPTAIPMNFGVQRYIPAGIDTRALKNLHKLYVRAGAGYPLQSTGDIYFTPRMAEDGDEVGIFLNHRGSWSHIDNELGATPFSQQAHYGGGIWGSRQGWRHKLEGQLLYDYRQYDAYGASGLDITQYAWAPEDIEMYDHFAYNKATDRINLGRVGASVNFGDNFRDLSHFNLHIGLDGGYSHSLKQTDINFHFKMAQMLGKRGYHGVEFGAWERGALAPNDRTAFTAVVTPRYILEINKFRLIAGLDIRYVGNHTSGQKGVTLAPAADMRFTLGDGKFVPYLNYSSRLLDGSPEALSRVNPYVVPELAATGWSDDLRVGIEGNFDNVFTYKLFGGLSRLDNYHLFISRNDIDVTADSRHLYNVYYSPTRFDVAATNGSLLTMGFEVAFHSLAGISAVVSGNWNKFSLDDVELNGIEQLTDPAGDLPKYEIALEMTYLHPRELFRITAGVKSLGERDFNNSYNITGTELYTAPGLWTNSVGPVIDFFASAEVKILYGFWAFIEGQNLANQRLYPYNHYRGLGISGMAGLKIVF